MSVGIGIRVRAGDFVVVRADTILRDNVTQEISSLGSDPDFTRRELQLVEVQTHGEGS